MNLNVGVILLKQHEENDGATHAYFNQFQPIQHLIDLLLVMSFIH